MPACSQIYLWLETLKYDALNILDEKTLSGTILLRCFFCRCRKELFIVSCTIASIAICKSVVTISCGAIICK